MLAVANLICRPLHVACLSSRLPLFPCSRYDGQDFVDDWMSRGQYFNLSNAGNYIYDVSPGLAGERGGRACLTVVVDCGLCRALGAGADSPRLTRLHAHAHTPGAWPCMHAARAFLCPGNCTADCPVHAALPPPQKVVPSLIPGIVLGCLALLGFFTFLVWMFIGCCRCLLCCKCFRSESKDDAAARDQFIRGGAGGPAAQVLRLVGQSWAQEGWSLGTAGRI